MEHLILQRNQSARSIRNVLAYLNEEEFYEQAISELKGRLVHLKSQWKLFANKNAVIAASEEDEQSKDQAYNLYDEIEEDYLKAKAALVKRIKELKLELQNEQQIQENVIPNRAEENNLSLTSEESISSNHAPLNNGQFVQGAKQCQAMNPAMMWQYPSFKSIENTWGEFNGSLTQWQGFHDRFKAAVHDNELIPRAFKFQYLKSSLKGQAAVALGEWQLSDENYTEAWERLKELYDREYQTSRQLLWKLIDLPRLERVNGFQIQKYCNITHEVLRQLRSLKYPVEHYDMIFVHLLHDRLDAETSKAWELKRDSERPKVQDMLKFLDAQAKAISGVHFVESKGSKSSKKNGANNNDNYERRPNLKRFGSSNSNENSEKSSGTPKKCKICDEPFHQLYRCEKFKKMNVPERKRVVRDHELCNNCFKPFHMSKDCFGKPCSRCDKKHNSLICPENPMNKLVLSTQAQSDSNPFAKQNTKGRKRERQQKKESSRNGDNL